MKTLLREALTAIAGFCEYGGIIRPIELRDKLQAAIDEYEQAPIFWWDGDTSSVQDSIDFKQSDTYKIPLYTAPQKPAAELQPDAMAVNFMRHAGLDKHKARECADIVSAVMAAQKGKI